MADYYPLLRKAVDALDRPDRDERYAVYERARRTVVNRLRGDDPPWSGRRNRRADPGARRRRTAHRARARAGARGPPDRHRPGGRACGHASRCAGRAAACSHASIEMGSRRRRHGRAADRGRGRLHGVSRPRPLARRAADARCRRGGRGRADQGTAARRAGGRRRRAGTLRAAQAARILPHHPSGRHGRDLAQPALPPCRAAEPGGDPLLDRRRSGMRAACRPVPDHRQGPAR